MRAGRLLRGGVRVDRPVLGISVQGKVKHVAVVARVGLKKKNVSTLFGLNSNSRRRSDRDANTIVRRHSKRGYGGNGIGCRRSMENVQPVVRSRGAVVHFGSEKEKDVLGSRALESTNSVEQYRTNQNMPCQRQY